MSLFSVLLVFGIALMLAWFWFSPRIRVQRQLRLISEAARNRAEQRVSELEQRVQVLETELQQAQAELDQLRR